MSVLKGHYSRTDEIEAIVSGFESCTTPPSEFSHSAHLTVAFSYLHFDKLTVEEATGRMRAGLYRYLDHNGVNRRKYNETMTIFWIKLVRSFLERADRGGPVADMANEMIEACGNSQLIFDYFSREILSSAETREKWVEPDLKPLDF